MNTRRHSASTRPGMRKANYVASVKVMLSQRHAKGGFRSFYIGFWQYRNRDKGVDRWRGRDIIHFTFWWCRIYPGGHDESRRFTEETRDVAGTGRAARAPGQGRGSAVRGRRVLRPRGRGAGEVRDAAPRGTGGHDGERGGERLRVLAAVLVQGTCGLRGGGVAGAGRKETGTAGSVQTDRGGRRLCGRTTERGSIAVGDRPRRAGLRTLRQADSSAEPRAGLGGREKKRPSTKTKGGH